MMKKLQRAWLTFCTLFLATVVMAQTDTTVVRDSVAADSVTIVADSMPERMKIAILTSLYLDSAFDAAGNYQYDDKQFHPFGKAGLEFWEGAQLAIDSLKKEGLKLDIHVFDTRSTRIPFDSLIAGNHLRSMNLIIGHVNLNEAAQLARFAAVLNIPFINTNVPNDAEVTNNPNYVVLNSTLFTHCNGIYKFLQRNFALSNIVVFRKKGAAEDRLRQYFTEIEKNTNSVALKLKYVTLPDNFNTAHLTAHLDSNSTNVVLAGSLDLKFAQSLCQQLSSLSRNYATTIFGMPNWDDIDFTKSLYRGIEVYITTPFYIDPANKLAGALNNFYRKEFFVPASPTVYLGYETIYHFAHLLDIHKENIGSSLGDKKYILFTDFDIQPVINRQSQTLDYFENKKLYMVKKVDGVVKAVY